MRVDEKKKGAPELEKTEVILGLRNDREVEISGIDEGTKVMLRPAPAAENETKI
jgi:hypothetical protein